MTKPVTWLKIALAVALLAGTASAVSFAAASASSRSVFNLAIDTAQYDSLAQQIATAWDLRAAPLTQPPGFLILLAAIYTAFGHSYLAVKLTFCALLSATALLAALVGWKRIGPLEGTITGILTISSPMLVAYAATLQYEVPAAFASMIVTALVLLPDQTQRRPARDLLWAIAIAATCAVAALLREVLIVLFPIAVAAVVFRGSLTRAMGRNVVVGAVMVAVFAAPIAAWTWAQYRRTGRIVVISTKSTQNFRIGSNAAANGTYHLQLQDVAEPSGWAFIRERPRQTATLAVRKSLYFWGLLRDPWTVPHPSAPVMSRALLNLVPFQWTLTVARGGAIAALFFLGLVMLRRRPDVWPAPAAVLVVMAVHIVYFAAQRFAVPVFPQIYIVAAIPLASLIRGVIARGRIGIAVAAAVIVWIVIAQAIQRPGVLRIEAESVEGKSAQNVSDPLAANGMARFAGAPTAPRPIAFLADEILPRGVFGIRVYARTADCRDGAKPALSVSLLDEDRAVKVRDSFTVADLCRTPGYNVLESRAVLRKDEVVDLQIDTLGVVDVWVDRVEIDFGYRELRQIPLTPK